MALASASPRTSAQIIPLPGAAVSPVTNPKRRLRYSTSDCNVTNIQKLRVDRSWRLHQEHAAAVASPLQWPLPPANPAVWPFGYVRRDQFETLNATDRAEIEGFIMGRVIHRQESSHV